jgi:NTE family protein
MADHDKKLDLVFEGGGVRGIGLVGALAVLEAEGYQFVNMAGTSAGAVIAALLAAGYGADDVRRIIMDLDFAKFKDTSLIGRVPGIGAVTKILMERGLYRGEFFLSLMRELLAAKGVHTFKDLVMPEFADDERYRYRLRVVASDISDMRMLALPQDIARFGMDMEELDVALAVRMSMSIPFFFSPVALEGPEGEIHYVMDGAMVSNFPVWLFDSDDDPLWPTFGLRLVAKPNAPPRASAKPARITNPLTLLLAIIQTATSAHDRRYIEMNDFARAVMIDTLGISATDFDLTTEEKERLYFSGVRAAEKFLKHWSFEQYKSLYRGEPGKVSRREQAMGDS